MLTKNMDYVEGIKLDIFFTIDNYVVVAINDNLSKFTLSNKRISEVNYHYLRKVKFPSHIFKYYIPLLEEVLMSYNKNKIIVLEINKINEKQMDILSLLLKEYPYKYYYINNSNIKINNKLLEIGDVLNNYIKTDNIENINNEIFIISNYPEKINKRLKYRQI